MIDLTEIQEMLDASDVERQKIKIRIGQIDAERVELESQYEQTKIDIAPFIATVDTQLAEQCESMRSALRDCAFDDKRCMSALNVAVATQCLTNLSEHATFHYLAGQRGGFEAYLLSSVDAFERKHHVFQALSDTQYPQLKALCEHFELSADELAKCVELFELKKDIQRKSFIMPLNVERAGPAPSEHELKRVSNPHLATM